MISNEEFRAAMSRFASGVTVITTRDVSGKRHGVTVSAFCSLSAEPPMVLVCLHKETACLPAFVERGAFVVNILSESQQHISEHFAAPTNDRFQDIELVETPSGLPVISGCLVTVECGLSTVIDGGDHDILVGLINSVTVSDKKPLLYYHHDYRRIDV